MSMKDWEESGGKPHAAPESPGGKVSLSTAPRAVFGTGPQFYKMPWFDPIARRRLLEMIGAVIIVGSVMYVMIPVFAGTGETSRRAVCATHLRRLVQAVKMYEVDNDGLPPTP